MGILYDRGSQPGGRVPLGGRQSLSGGTPASQFSQSFEKLYTMKPLYKTISTQYLMKIYQVFKCVLILIHER
jgi:hypothetical protein